MVNSLDWKDISDLYEEAELVEEESLEEKLSPAARMKKQRDFRRTGVRRNLARNIKLHRVSSPDQLRNRAVVAARRLLSRKFLQGRDKASLSPQEKDILEQRLKRLRELGVQDVLSQRLMPKIRQIERSRLKSKSHK